MREIAISLLDRLMDADEMVIGTQVMGEFFNSITRKCKPPLTRAEASVGVDLLSRLPIIETDASLVKAAVERCQQSQISYYDALIVEAALRAGATTLYTEDMQDGMRYGNLELRDPIPTKKNAAPK